MNEYFFPTVYHHLTHTLELLLEKSDSISHVVLMLPLCVRLLRRMCVGPSPYPEHYSNPQISNNEG